MSKKGNHQELKQRIKVFEQTLQGEAKRLFADLLKANAALTEELEKYRKAGAALRKGKKRYQFLFDFSPIAFSESDWSEVKRYIEVLQKAGIKDFRSYFRDNPEEAVNCLDKITILNVNKAMVRIFDARGKKEFMKSLKKTFAEESYENFREKLIAYAEGKDRVEATGVGKTLEGEKRHFAMKWSFLPETQEKRTRMLDVLVDITGLHQAEEELTKFKTISDSANVGNAISKSLDGTMIYVNKAFAQMHGYEIQELIGKPFSVLHTEEQMKHMGPLIAALFKKGSLENVELWHMKKDGTLFPVLSNATLISDQNGSPLFISTTAIDLTERKKMESEMEIKSRNLDDATAALRVVIENGEKQRLQQQEDLLNNIRSLLKPSIEKLRRSGLTAEQREYLDTLESKISGSTAPALENLSSKYPNLSPTEVKVASFIKLGKKTPEIARMLHVSNRTIEVHRNHIRKKLGIKDQKINLHTFLLSVK